jgi:exonuclease III
MRNKSIPLHISSLNCNSLAKTSSPKTQSSYIRYLRQLDSTIFTFQETHASEITIPRLNAQLQCRTAFWTQHCGIVSFSLDFDLDLIPTPSDRSLLTRITHPHGFFEPLYLLTLYAPAKPPHQRRAFFGEILRLVQDLVANNTIDLDRLIITGDFNYSLLQGTLTTHTDMNWITYLDKHFFNAMQINDCHQLPTFERSSGCMSTIDYIYVGMELQNQVQDSNIVSIRSDWSDHSILSTTVLVGYSKLGPGLWRANPTYVTSTAFQDQLVKLLDDFFRLASELSPQALWDDMKDKIRTLVKTFGKAYVPWRRSTLKALQRRRNQFLRSKPSVSLRSTVLPPLDRMIHGLQQEMADIQATKAGIIWRERSERSAGYLKRIHQRRQGQQYIAALATDSPDSRPSTDTGTKETIAQDFYQTLYSADTVAPQQIDTYLDNIHFHRRISDSDGQDLMAPIESDDILIQANRMTKSSSPGEDGFGYPYWSLILNHPAAKSLATKVYNQALQAGCFPPSWQQIRVRLLPKKGALTSLKNWRPISLINCDAKIFTRIVTKRLAPILHKAIHPQQTGFLPGRFIAENGLALQLIMEQAQLQQKPGIGMLLDQEKAYDRVHPLYLEKTMLAMGLPVAFVGAIKNLFFGNKIKVNINGNFTNDIYQQRGLRQGDPLSPLLFNLALEPFLLSIKNDPGFQGFAFSPLNLPTIDPMPLALKCMAYADDVCVFLSNPADLTRLHDHIQAYTAVSNALFNHHKTEAFALNGRRHDDWSALLDHHAIPRYYHRFSPTGFRYLGFNICYTDNHRKQVEQHLLEIVKSQIKIYSQRNLSIRGRATIANSLILSKVWFALRQLVASSSFFQALIKIMSAFVGGSSQPKLSFTQMCQPMENGGLNLLHPKHQQLAMQLRWIGSMLRSDASTSFLTPILIHHLSLIPGVPPDPRQALFFPAFRQGPLCELSRTTRLWFAAFDALPVPFPVHCANVSNCLALPLHHLLILPSSHWLHKTKYQRLLGASLFVYDDQQHSLRPRIPREQSRPRCLLRRLYRDLLAASSRTVDLQPWMWSLIDVPINPAVTSSIAPLIQGFLDAPFWSSFDNKYYRAHLLPGSLPPYKYPLRAIKSFWSAPMSPYARTTWYKILTQKVPLQPLLARLHPQDPRCVHCHGEEDLAHFVYLCPKKRPIWEAVLSRHLPLHFLRPSSHLEFILYFRSPPPSLPLAQALTLFSTIIHKLWSAHWQFKIHAVPFHEFTITKSINTKLSNIQHS